MKLNNKNYNKKDILSRTGSVFQMAGTQKYVLEDGFGKGTSLIRVRNGKNLDFNILADKGLDIYDISFAGTQLAWLSKNKIVANQYLVPDGLGWLRIFGGGMMVSCGMRNVGPPVEDGGESFGLHGRLTGVPAQNVSIKEFWENDIFYQEISGEMRESSVFGENLLLKRTIKVNSEQAVIELHDKIINEGFNKEQIMLLYHFNWGFPLFSENAELKLDSANIRQRGDSDEGLKNWNKFTSPIHNFQEEVFFHELNPDKANQVSYELKNPDLNMGVKVSWDKSQLPWLTQWKMTAESEYVLGLEPGNALPLGRVEMREKEQTEYLEPFSEKDVKLKIEFNKLR